MDRHYLLLFTLLLLFTTTAAKSSKFDNYSIKNIFETKEACYNESFVFVSNDKLPIDATKVFRSIDNTGSCVKRLEAQGEIPEDLENCPPGLVDLNVQAAFVAKSQVSYPYSTMNISTTIHSPEVTSVFIRLQCVTSEDGADVYCSNHQSMLINGVRVWPCRGMEVLSPESITYPARFSYKCFKLTPHSVYMVNATVFPQKCRHSAIFTIPAMEDLFPSKLMDGRDENPKWSPMIVADLSETNTVWLRLYKAEKAYCQTIKVNLYHNEMEHHWSYYDQIELKCPENSIKLNHLIKGTYLVVAYVPYKGCAFQCEKDDKYCDRCIRTVMNFTLPYNRASIPWVAVNHVKHNIYAVLFSILLLILLMGVGLILYLRYKTRQMLANQVDREIPLNDIVKAFMVYSDDCDEHSSVVAALVGALRNNSCVDLYYDIEELNDPGRNVQPARWIVDTFMHARKHIIVISPCSARIVNKSPASTYHLAQSKPWIDIFQPVTDLVLRKWALNSDEASRQMCIVRFPYSPPTPERLELLGITTFEIPSQFSELTAFMHDIDYVNDNMRPILHDADIEIFDKKIQAMFDFMEENPEWIDTRWVPKPPEHHEPPSSSRRIEQYPPRVNLTTAEDYAEASKKYGLKAPDELSDDSDSDSDDSDSDDNRNRNSSKINNATTTFVLEENELTNTTANSSTDQQPLLR